LFEDDYFGYLVLGFFESDELIGLLLLSFVFCNNGEKLSGVFVSLCGGFLSDI